ncbi:spermidine/putrescine ABC transporter ATP-binding protein [Rhizobium phaseoli]|uniref:Spermidine/putrescine import ATP-binding protein PotA n=1 Tax=Rhizobium phaseoli TaxID=396 RepID=A0A192T5S9_9HYPH|nr:MULTISPECIES: ABC transporter ATP-binding protein [Rhizobium]MDH6647174.1 putative spermidine/putrescine transport system ATP-binding protein [Rhizobium esperanzae]ANL26081.1 spermidine/putrescine ABC transporter ATP-binding protein [Rhizobium phaseoli]ANL38648.1 spermidine/putrescine ABC transporter ATP-binding protein [Rhizobium phaseoli]ANL51397.1 spermidine/putrescine ABC transporter ATP-binding protein [Rhizobium phaseoli]ANL57637.1 spermidine/putrescine ABC transporter ATP-binding pro
MAAPRIRFEKISKSFGLHQVVKDLSLDIERGEFVSLLGPSGSGKTTLLMMLAGFENPTAGGIFLDGRRIDHLPPHRREMGVVFQNYALFPHMSIADNIAFPLRMRGVGRGEIEERVNRALEMVQLSAMSGRKPAQLSGGQQQRVALARSLVFEPTVVLMDEPLGALDKQLREQMQLDIRALHKRLELTVVFVTHDQSEALTMSDRIAVFNRGNIEQIGSPRDIYDRPQTRAVAEFIGETNLIEGTVKMTGTDGTSVEIADGRHVIVPGSNSLAVGSRVHISVRPERICLAARGISAAANALPAKILDSVYQGDHLRVQLDEDAFRFVVRTDMRSAEWPVGADVVAHFTPDDCWVIAA